MDINCNAWYVDSGATCHMTNNKNLLKNYVVDTPRLVTAANNQKMCTEGHGDVELVLKGQQNTTTISEVIFVPGLSTNLLSVSKLTAKGLRVHFNEKGCSIRYGETVIASATKKNGVYQLNTNSESSDGSVLTSIYQPMTDSRSLERKSVTEAETGRSEQVGACRSADEGQPSLETRSTTEGQAEGAYLCDVITSQELWHRRLGHLNRRSMELLKKDISQRAWHPTSDNRALLTAAKWSGGEGQSHHHGSCKMHATRCWTGEEILGRGSQHGHLH